MNKTSLEKVKIGIVGPSWWINYWHLPAIQNHPNAEIVAICGDTPRNLIDIQEKYGENAQYFTDLEKMLESVEIDGVIVCTPNDLHHPATMAAFKRNIHVSCEKPLALKADQAYEMMWEAQNRNLLGMTNFPYRDNPCVQEFRRLLSESAIGKILHIAGQYHGGFGLRHSPNWRGKRDRSGAGILGDLGSHLIDLVRFITQEEFQSVCANNMTVLWNLEEEDSKFPDLVRTEDSRVGNRNDDSCMFLAEMASGAQATLHTSWVAYQGSYCQHQEIEIYGTEGRLHFLATHTGTFLRILPNGEKVWKQLTIAGVLSPQEASQLEKKDDEDYFRPGRKTPTNTTYRWIEAIRTNQASISPSLEDGWQAQRVIDAILQSSAERRWVDI